MKKFLFVTILCVTAVILTGCQSDTKDAVQQTPPAATASDLAKKYVEDSIYIELDVYGLADGIAKSHTRSASVNQEDMAKMKAALYRFYSHVELVGDTYICNLTSAEEINVSQGVYTALLNNLTDMNNTIQQFKKEGKELYIQKVDTTYLNSLLE